MNSRRRLQPPNQPYPPPPVRRRLQPPPQPYPSPPRHQTPALTKKLPYFSKWTRERVKQAIDSGEAVSLYVENISSEWEPMDVFRIMSKYGEVMDVYVPGKKTRQGCRFCFVRFWGINDIRRLIQDVQRVSVEEGNIRANLARQRQYRRPIPSTWPLNRTVSGHRIGKTNASTVQEQQSDHVHQGLSFFPTSDALAWISRCAIATVRNPAEMGAAMYVWSLHGLVDVTVFEFGGIRCWSIFRLLRLCKTSYKRSRTGLRCGSLLLNHGKMGIE
ncbi:hypothetical protein Tsubulata_013591 [Turnera subulata]|uniref:RRM domain-containing protein n=1 Tax=Turnera subulata TaxID=218843 RepID=A0A9Q0FS68_9ROSI|nr:hypothetical protein Tsubulata_013591 [Turnera subulata]